MRWLIPLTLILGVALGCVLGPTLFKVDSDSEIEPKKPVPSAASIGKAQKLPDQLPSQPSTVDSDGVDRSNWKPRSFWSLPEEARKRIRAEEAKVRKLKEKVDVLEIENRSLRQDLLWEKTLGPEYKKQYPEDEPETILRVYKILIGKNENFDFSPKELHELAPLMEEFSESYRKLRERELSHQDRKQPSADARRRLVQEAEKFLSDRNRELFREAYSW